MDFSNTENSRITNLTISHYESNPKGFWEGTKDHDVSQNYNALLCNIKGEAPFNILDFGCGPGRDLHYFKSIGHNPTGLDGCEAFCTMAREHSGCEVLHQNFIDLNLPSESFHGIFANASLFHIPKNIFKGVLKKLHDALKPEGILFSSNPRGHGESVSGNRYGFYVELEEYQKLVEDAGFKLIHHYYRPESLPLVERPWLACVFRKV